MNKNKGARKRSSIFSGLTRFSEFVYSKMPESLSARLLVGSKKPKNGLLLKLISKLNFKRRVSLPVKRFIAKSFDNSFIVCKLKQLISKIPVLQFKCVGLFYFSFGLCSTVVTLVRANLLSDGVGNIPLYLSVASCVIGGIFCGSQKNCYTAFSESKIMSGIFFDFLNIPKNDSFLREEPIGRPTYFLIGGIVAGVIGTFTSVQFVLFLFPVLLALYAVFAFPESGAIALFLFLPFLSSGQLAAFCVLISLSWFIKLLRGRRVFKFTTLDLTVLTFGVAILLGGLVSVSPKESTETSYIMLAMLIAYFSVSNLLRTAELIRKCGTALIISFSVSLTASVIGQILQFISDTRGAIFNEIFSEATLPLMSVNQTFIHMAVAVIPLMMLRSAASKNATKTAWAVIAVILTLICLFMGGSRSGTLATIIALALLLMLVSRRSLSYIIPAIIIIPLVVALMPATVTNAVDKLFSFDGTIASYRRTVNYTTNKMLLDSFFGGIGLGEDAFAKIYPLYTNDLSLQINHTSALYTQITISLGLSGLIVFLIFVAQLLRRYFSYIVSSRNDDPYLRTSAVSTFSGLCALLIMGLIDYIWLSHSVFLMFWLMTALFSASVKTAEAERYALPSDGPSLEIDCKTLNHFSKRKG